MTRGVRATWIGCGLLIVYVALYASLRTNRRSADGGREFDLGSRAANGLFAPVIRLERRWRGEAPPDMLVRLEEAILEARRTDRRVLLTLGTESCLPCRQLEAFLDSQRDLLDRHYVVVRIDVDGLHGDVVQERRRPVVDNLESRRYFPWLAIVAADGRTLRTGDDGPAGVIGLAQGGPADRAWFLELLRSTTPELDAQELAMLDKAAEVYGDALRKAVR